MRQISSSPANLTARRRLLALALATPFFAIFGSSIYAQSLPEERSPKVNLTVEQRHIVKELVKDLQVSR